MKWNKPQQKPITEAKRATASGILFFKMREILRTIDQILGLRTIKEKTYLLNDM